MEDAGVESAGGIWPGAIVHVNEDGWVLVNRGSQHGVVSGLGLLVVGDEARELRDTAVEGEPPALLRIRRTFELLEVVYAEGQFAVAIAARVPRERRPQVYRAPTGELLVWVPLSPQYTWPSPAVDTGDDAADGQDQDEGAEDDDAAGDEEAVDAANTVESADTESLAEQQEDDRWEQALPLNGLHVGDLVLPAIPAVSAGGGPLPSAAINVADAGATPGPIEHRDTLFDAGRDYE